MIDETLDERGRLIANREMSDITPAELRGYHAIIKERLNIDCTNDPDPLIDLRDMAALAGLSPSTTGQQRQRSKDGLGKVRFPGEDPVLGTRWPEKPLFRAVTAVIPYLEATGNWPPEAGARPSARGKRDETAKPNEPKYTFAELRKEAPRTYHKIRRAEIGTSGRRTLARWKAALNKAAA